jgi:glycosyltransferase involved in cell wall biosynthesis
MAPTARGLRFYKDFPVIVLFRLFRRETILHFHNKGITKYQGKWLDDKLYQFAFWNTKVILLSNRLYFDVEKYVSKKDTFICPNGIPGRVITKSENLATAVYLLYLSNMMKEKGVYDLLDACDSLKRKGLDFECHFVGEWSDITQKDFTREIEKKHLGNKVFVHGPKYGHEKEMFYNKANIFIFPTFNECFPLVLVEAMQYALPVISTNEGGIPDIVDNGLTGYIIEKKKLKELADRIEELMLNPTLRISMGKAGQKKFQERYTLECFEKRLCEIIITTIE